MASTPIHSEITNERGRIDECGEHAGALVAEGSGVVSRAGLKVDRGKAQQQGQEVRDVVAGFGEQRQRVSAQSGDKRDHDIGQGGRQRKCAVPMSSFLRPDPRAPRGHAYR